MGRSEGGQGGHGKPVMVAVKDVKRVQNDLGSEMKGVKPVMTQVDSRDHSMVRKGGDQVCQGAHEKSERVKE